MAAASAADTEAGGGGETAEGNDSDGEDETLVELLPAQGENNMDTNISPIDTDTAPMGTDTAPMDTDTAPMDTDNAPTDTYTAPIDTDTAPMGTDTAPTDTDTAPMGTDTAPMDTNTAPTDTDSWEQSQRQEPAAAAAPERERGEHQPTQTHEQVIGQQHQV